MADHEAELRKAAESISDELKTHNFSERLQWLEKTRTRGNELMKDENYGKALQEYLKC